MSAEKHGRPLVGLVCDRFFLGEHDQHGAKHSYVRALMSDANVSPVLIPAVREIESMDAYLDGVSGLLFPGGASNVEAHRYGGEVSRDQLCDPDRDHVALELMRGAAARGMPLLAICRGFQEMNVAFGGTLHADIYASGHCADHLEDLAEDLPTRYRYRHEVELAPAGMLTTLANARRVRVNSLHRQGVAVAAPRLVVEARAPDGLIEACRLNGHDFALGVQWHPEVMTQHDALSRSIFDAFGASCRAYRHPAQRATDHHEG
ncbi:gamma-glutamyl-gamma-aminobutyrate hydrolase family protein [Paraburkholderia sp. LEh10]|jgi:putative glutamine amidotransferase|uniref:gamma-glutamyl-gamma-aminobutyrate hydrolase family protein n=1 Tax=Paraburkholderia sp. LEh10 TaxID=2821353 RepID=UPI001AE4200F|nr:gamma-glutamyl-gamma-aminobutyrate hydrolase family protein [Paraburkholderia sp. LEh10]MBP0592052.1 gamma-glutamyl-gamma-aminobutyrate hydrolase family protein [Paraburkholderia sp. LEh10]